MQSKRFDHRGVQSFPSLLLIEKTIMCRYLSLIIHSCSFAFHALFFVLFSPCGALPLSRVSFPYVTVVEFCPRMAHQAMNTSLQCVATHSLLQYSLSQSLLSTAGLVQPARTQMLRLAAVVTLGTGATFTSTSIPSSASATSSPPVTISADCPTSTVRSAEDTDVGVSPADVTMIGALESDCRDDGTTLICSGGGAVAAFAPPPRGLACRGGGAWACTIC